MDYIRLLQYVFSTNINILLKENNMVLSNFYLYYSKMAVTKMYATPPKNQFASAHYIFNTVKHALWY